MAGMRIVLVGAGGRGGVYADELADTAAGLAAIVDPRPEWRDSVADRHGVPVSARFASLAELATSPLAGEIDGAINATPDRAHADTAAQIVEVGWPMLLEKPVGVTGDELDALARLVSPSTPPIAVAHVLRYTTFYRALRAEIASGVVGTVTSVTHHENLWFNHFAHSFVRGNWGNSASSSPFVLAKCCHDLDLFRWLFDDEFQSVVSSGDLGHYVADNRPADAPPRCTDGCTVDCRYDARPLYLHDRDHWPANTIAPPSADPLAARRHALEAGPYGRCVYGCDNDAPDRQVASFSTTSGAVMTLVISGHHHEETRLTHIDGTDGSIMARFGRHPSIEVHPHRGTSRSVDLDGGGSGGHGGGDAGIVAHFLDLVADPTQRSGSDLLDAIPSHRAALAAEEARATGRRVAISVGTSA